MTNGNLRMQFMAALSGTLVYAISGTYTGWASPTVARLRKGKDEPYLSSGDAAWIVSIINVPQLVACIPAAYLANAYGRKTTMLMSTVPFIISWLLVTFGSSVWMLYVARLIGGIGLGLSNTAAPMYVIEVAEDRVRGALGTIFMFMMNAGLVFEESIGPYVSRAVLGAVSLIFPILFAVTFFWMPESPYYYLIHKKKQDAQKSLMRLRGVRNSEYVKDELYRMEQFVEETSQNKGTIRELLFQRGNRKAFFIMVGLMTFQSFCGIIAILSYSTTIFEESGITLNPSITVIIMGVIQTLLSVVSPSTVDIAGRRPMLLISAGGCALSLAVEGLHFYLKSIPGTDASGFDWVPLSAMALYIITFTFGVGTIPNVIIAEIFPTNVKGLALSIAAMLVAAYSIVVTKLYQLVADEYGVHVVFWVFAAFTVANVVFVAIMVPETKGKTLMEIHKELSSSENEDALSKSSSSFDVTVK